MSDQEELIYVIFDCSSRMRGTSACNSVEHSTFLYINDIEGL